jgi:hypothetical protein
MKTKIHTASPKHEIVYQDLVAMVRKHAGHLDAIEMLAIAANMLGKLCALQDQRVYTPAMVMEIVVQNVEEGNRQAVAEVMNSKGTS